jgi:hypothetical protein
MVTVPEFELENPMSSRTLDDFSREHGASPGIDLDDLETGTVVNVETRHSSYRLLVVDGATHKVLIKGGRLFADDTPARIDGSTIGGSILASGRIIIGFRLELSAGGHAVVTSPVQSVEADSEREVLSSES